MSLGQILRLSGRHISRLENNLRGNLKVLELYREKRFSDRLRRAPSIEGNIGALDDETASVVTTYMENAPILIEFGTDITDPHFTQDRVRYVLFSDGYYVWDGIILNWVRKHRVRLPREFTEHVIENVGNNDRLTSLNTGELLQAVKFAEPVFADDGPAE